MVHFTTISAVYGDASTEMRSQTGVLKAFVYVLANALVVYFILGQITQSTIFAFKEIHRPLQSAALVGNEQFFDLP